MIERIALYTTLGLLINSFGVETWGGSYWCLLALFWAADILGREQGQIAAAEEYQAALQDAATGIKKYSADVDYYKQQVLDLTKKLNEKHRSS